jgi:integrase
MAKKKLKRANNEGSIYQRSNGTWRAQVTIDGKRLGRTTKTQKEGREWIREMLNQIDEGLTYSNSKLTLAQYIQEWLVSVENTLRPSTFKQYTQYAKNHITPYLGKLRLIDLRPDHIQKRYNQMAKEGYGPRTVQLVHAVLRRSLGKAVKLRLISRNPAKAVTPPKSIPKEMKFLDEKQIQQLLSTAGENKDHLYALYFLAIATGMRQGELLGLKWADLNWETGKLQVIRQLTRAKRGGFEFTQPKTKAGQRTIQLSKEVLEVLKEHRKYQQYMYSFNHHRWADDNLIFTNTIGSPLDKYNLLKRFKKLLKKAGLPDIRFHDLRHTAASIMLNNGIPVIIVSRILGHAKPSTTMDIYGHLIPGKQKEAASLMGRVLTNGS